MNRKKLVSYLDDYLSIESISDSSLNGLQVEGASRVDRIAVAVDACQRSITAAAKWRADFLIVHHGLFWSRHERITGVMHGRVASLIKDKISLYAAHLPLDCHEEIGNNVELIRLLGLKLGSRFGNYRGVEIGYLAESDRLLTRNNLREKLAKVLNSPVQLLSFGPPRIRRVGVISGGAAPFAEAAGLLGCDAFVTGEASHTAYHVAKEARVNLFYAGHYASETVGVKALARHLQEMFSLKCRFFPTPTGS